MNRLLALAALAASMGASAQDTIPERNAFAPTAFGFHVVSVHSTPIDVTAGRPWNNSNPGVYARWDRWVAGTYYNSIRRHSVYAGYAYPLFENLDIVVGVVTGYDGPGYTSKPIMPMVVPSAHFALTKDISVRLNLAIGVQKNAATALNVALEWKL
jgi:hypothetical protein